MRLAALERQPVRRVAVVSIVLAAATVWLFLTNPVTVATAVNEGDVSPLVRSRACAQVHASNALSGPCLRTDICLIPGVTHLSRLFFRNLVRTHPSTILERRLAGAVVAAGQDRDLVRDVALAELAHEILGEIDRKRQVVPRVDEQRPPVAQRDRDTSRGLIGFHSARSSSRSMWPSSPSRTCRWRGRARRRRRSTARCD